MKKNKKEDSGQWARLKANEDLVIKIAKDYRREGKNTVNWKKAMAEHPEWEKTLIGEDGKDVYLHIFANTLKKAGKIPGMTVTPRTPAVRASRKPVARRVETPESMTVEGIGAVNGRNAKFSFTVEYL